MVRIVPQGSAGIREITSVDGSVSISDPFGPVTDLSVFEPTAIANGAVSLTAPAGTAPNGTSTFIQPTAVEFNTDGGGTIFQVTLNNNAPVKPLQVGIYSVWTYIAWDSAFPAQAHEVLSSSGMGIHPPSTLVFPFVLSREDQVVQSSLGFFSSAHQMVYVRDAPFTSEQFNINVTLDAGADAPYLFARLWVYWLGRLGNIT